MFGVWCFVFRCFVVVFAFVSFVVVELGVTCLGCL